RRDAEALRREREDLWVRLATDDVAARDHGLEPLAAAEPLERQLDVLRRSRRPDGEQEPGGGERIDQRHGAVHRREVGADQVAVDGLLARVQRLPLGIVEFGAPEAGDDLAAGLAERGG